MLKDETTLVLSYGLSFRIFLTEDGVVGSLINDENSQKQFLRVALKIVFYCFSRILQNYHNYYLFNNL